MKENGKIFFGAADRSLRASINVKIIEIIRSLGFSVISEHATGKDFNETAGKLEQVLGPLPPKGKDRTVFIRNQMIAWIESEIVAAVFEASTPSLSAGIEIAHAYLRPRMGFSAIPVIIFYEKGFWPQGLSAMIAGITPKNVPGVHLLEYKREQEIAGLLRPLLPDPEGFSEQSGPERALDVRGRVTARKCPLCGHHEIGLETSAGEFVALKPGMRAALG